MSIEAAAGMGLPRPLEPAATLGAADPQAVGQFNAVLGNAGEVRQVSDAELQQAIGDSIMTQMINKTFEDLRRHLAVIKG